MIRLSSARSTSWSTYFFYLIRVTASANSSRCPLLSNVKSEYRCEMNWSWTWTLPLPCCYQLGRNKDALFCVFVFVPTWSWFRSAIFFLFCIFGEGGTSGKNTNLHISPKHSFGCVLLAPWQFKVQCSNAVCFFYFFCLFAPQCWGKYLAIYTSLKNVRLCQLVANVVIPPFKAWQAAAQWVNRAALAELSCLQRMGGKKKHGWWEECFWTKIVEL